MGKKSKPKAGSMAYYPRVRAKSMIPKFNSLTMPKEDGVKVLNFYGYKVGMLHVMGINKHKGSPFNNQKVAISSTLVEFPPITVFGLRFYGGRVKKAMKDFVFTSKSGKFLSKRLSGITKAKEKGDLLKNALDFFETNKGKIKNLVLIAQTHPEKTTIGKKSPEVIELHLSGKPEDQIDFFKEKLGKDLEFNDFGKEDLYVDIKGITIGKGFQGVVKRFGIKRRHHKSEKGVRKIGATGPWHPPLIMSTVPRAGQMGCHNRVQANQKVLKILEPKDVAKKAGWEDYGVVKNKAVIFTGSLPGPVKRLLAFRFAGRKHKDVKTDISEITNIVL